MRLAYTPYTLDFKNPAGTSRGILHKKLTYFIKIYDERDPEHYGIGEAALFPGLSAEDDDKYELKLVETLANVAIGRPTDLSRHPSIRFGLEQAILNFSNGCGDIYFPSDFTAGKESIVINGLVWMGNKDEMMSRLDDKIKAGFHCIKIKIGAIRLTDELDLIRSIRSRWSENDIEIRVDANGGFSMDNVFPVLKRLADLGVHSIEQPIPAGMPELMQFVCNLSPVPVALDEELIGVATVEEKHALLSETRPAYIVLKPSLAGGIEGCGEWIEEAQRLGIGWWITSALESNIGLNALAQWVATLNVRMPQGLGTGNLFTNNFESPLSLIGERLEYDPALSINREALDKLPWRS